MKRAVVTGATSFIGINLIKKLISDGVFVYAVVRKGSDKKKLLSGENNLTFVEADMSELSSLPKIIDSECDTFYHLAWDGTRGEARNDKEKQQRNLQYSFCAVEAAIKLGCSLFMGAGSQAEYGSVKAMITEDTELKPITEYGKAKAQFCIKAAEVCAQNNIAFRWPRFFSLYGPGDFEGTMIMSMAKNMLENRDFDLTQCIQMWDFLHISDAVDGMIKLSELKFSDGVYNFGSGDARPLKEFVEIVYRLCGSKSKLNYGAVAYPQEGPVNIQPDVTKLKRETLWEPKIDFETGIRGIIKAYNKDEE